MDPESDQETRHASRERQLINQLVAFVAVLEVDGRLVDVDAAALNIGGIGIDDVRGIPFWNTYWWSYDPEVQDEVRDAVHRAAAGETVRLESVVRVAGDGRLPILWQVGPIRGEHDQVVELVASASDISERRRAEEEMERNRLACVRQVAELEALYDALPVGVALHDRDLAFLRVNRHLADLNGLPIAQHYERSGRELLDSIDPALADVIRSVFRSGQPSLGHEIRAETPAVRDASRDFVADYYPVKVDGEAFAVGTCVREVTAERQLQNQLAASEARLRRVTDEAPILIALLDAEGRITWANRDVLRRFGDSAERHAGTDYATLLAPHLETPGDEALLRQAVQGAAAGRPSRLDLELTRGGGREVLEIQVTPLGARDGRVTEIVATGTDVTDRRLHEERLRLLNRELNHRMKNLFALVQSVITMSARGEKDVGRYVETLRGRVEALAAAHLIGTVDETMGTIRVRDLVATVLEPHERGGSRMTIEGPEFRLSRSAATPLGMILHELATNAVKHGALGGGEGTLAIRWRLTGNEGRELELHWTEDAPSREMAGEASSGGFGTRLMQGCAMQLQGRLSQAAHARGVDTTLTFPSDEPT
ncbi:PAS domain-containing sensor histidine kinase [Roseitranquillus sediminis]|uniref:PAS domain-containing sensor histidine kinase n=1 Tax=Roseitranquillus sediminis TaxID=2809051 RepID=UPI001D0CC764|nr:PAS domain-containing protein [Roseitranquillus sediminis]MBM9594969.1 PAS domain-containing protein [Roseitranquillus sediminis]